MILSQMFFLFMRIFYHNLVIETLLTSSIFLILSPPSNLGLYTKSHATKGSPSVSSDPKLDAHKNFLLILSKSSLFFLVSLKQFITCKGKLAKFVFIRTTLLERNCAFKDANFFFRFSEYFIKGTSFYFVMDPRYLLMPLEIGMFNTLSNLLFVAP